MSQILSILIQIIEPNDNLINNWSKKFKCSFNILSPFVNHSLPILTLFESLNYWSNKYFVIFPEADPRFLRQGPPESEPAAGYFLAIVRFPCLLSKYNNVFTSDNNLWKTERNLMLSHKNNPKVDRSRNEWNSPSLSLCQADTLVSDP